MHTMVYARTTGKAGNATDRDGMTCARFSLRVLQTCRKHAVFYTVEQPRSSGMWQWPPLADCLHRDGAVEVHLDTCQYGTLARPSRSPPPSAAFSPACTSSAGGAAVASIKSAFRAP